MTNFSAVRDGRSRSLKFWVAKYLATTLVGCGEVWGNEVGGEGGAGFDVGIFAVVEEGEWADDRDKDGGVGRRCLAFESGGSAESYEAERGVQRVHLEIDFAGSAAGTGLFDLSDGDGGGITFVSDDGVVDGEIVGQGEENFVTDFGGLGGDVLREDEMYGNAGGICGC